MQGFKAVSDLVEIMAVEERVRENETDRWRRVN